MTHDELVLLLQSFGYGTNDATVESTFINDAWKWVCRQRAWSWLRTVRSATATPGSVEYTYADFGITDAETPRRLESLRIVDGTVFPPEPWTLDWVAPADMNDKRGSVATVIDVGDWDIPSEWTLMTESGTPFISIWYPPDKAYELVLAFTRSANVLSGTVAPFIPSDYAPVIAYQAAYAMAARQRDTVALNEFRAERDAILRQAAADENALQLHTIERMGGDDRVGV